MKVWHGFTLVFWTILLQVCFTVILLHYSLQASVLNREVIKTRLAQSNSYEIIRDLALTDRITVAITERYPENTLIDRAMVAGAVAEAFPAKEVQGRVEPAIDVLYQWLDSKRPDIVFELPIGDRFEQFYGSLETRVGQKIAALPACREYFYSPEEAVLLNGCLPVHISAVEATRAIMDMVRRDQSTIAPTVTVDSVTIPAEQLAPLKQIPTYLNYLWALSYLMMGVAVLATLFLLIARRLHGVMAIGTAAMLAGATLWLLQFMIATASKPSDEPILATLQTVLIPAFTSVASLYGLSTFMVGLVIIVAAALWRYTRKRRLTHG